MKLTIEAETDAERERYPEPVILGMVCQFAFVGMRGPIGAEPFSHTWAGPFGWPSLWGQLEECKQRVREHGRRDSLQCK